jgi:hypothetical protein
VTDVAPNRAPARVEMHLKLLARRGIEGVAPQMIAAAMKWNLRTDRTLRGRKLIQLLLADLRMRSKTARTCVCKALAPVRVCIAISNGNSG